MPGGAPPSGAAPGGPGTVLVCIVREICTHLGGRLPMPGDGMPGAAMPGGEPAKRGGPLYPGAPARVRVSSRQTAF